MTNSDYMGLVASLGCVVCRNLELGPTPAQVHHIRHGQGGAMRAPDFLTIPLCEQHHTGRFGFHTDRSMFELRFGSELSLLAQTIKEVCEQLILRNPCAT